MQEFQRYAIASDVVGISQEKLADQLKDFTEKVGEFQQTGGGGMKDFFEQIAPQIDLTADAFRGLSGPQALQLYYDSLEKAGASQEQMSFYLESMASDTTALIPLLRDGGAGFKLLGDQAEQAGAIIGNDTLNSVDKLNAAIFISEQATAGFKNQIADALLPVLADLATEFGDVTADGYIAAEMGETLGNVVKGISAAAFGAYAAFQLFGKGIAAMAAGFNAAGVEASDLLYGPLAPGVIGAKVAKNFDAFKGAIEVGFDDIAVSADKYASVLDGIWSAGSGNQVDDPNSNLNKVAELLKTLREQAGGTRRELIGFSDENEEAAKAAAKAAAAIQSELTALERAAITWGMSADQVKIYDLQMQGATDTQVEYAKSLLSLVDGLERAEEEQNQYLELVKELRTDEEKLTETFYDRIAVLDAMAGAYRISSDEYQKMLERAADAAFSDAPTFSGLAPEIGGAAGELSKLDDAEKELGKWYESQLEMLEDYRSERADLTAQWDEQELALKQEHEDRLAQIEQARRAAQLETAAMLFGDMADLAKVFAGEQSTAYKALFASEKAYSIASTLVQSFPAIAKAWASAPFPANIPAVAITTAETGALQAAAQAVSLAGMAHEGIDSIPQTGTWLLEKGERVTTAETSAKMDRVLEDIRAGQRSGSGGGQPISVSVDLSGMRDAREVRRAESSVRRGVAQGVAQAQRYS
ncbi:phage tail tape measure protein [Pseudomonas abyssi]|uniref:phage tail tape measure protein n=1 Tax=Pseudomonas abyssi TaxID=170540 RepID=UPI0011C0D074|nr:phage tail tape measure protein [Halopseudomonas gallaeciensis]